jgi:hypothetical protein
MKRPLSVILAITGVLVCAVLLIFGYVVYSYGKPTATYVTTSGAIGDVTIGDTKEVILGNLPNQQFSLTPKPTDCPVSWIKVAEMSHTEYGCLMKVDTWEEGSPSTGKLCPKNRDVFTTLRFKAGQLASVTTTCMRPE